MSPIIKNLKVSSRLALIAAVSLVIGDFSAQAQNTSLYYDTNGTAAGLGGSGPWDLTTVNWDTSNSGTGPLIAYPNATGTTTTAFFAGTSGTVTIASGTAINVNSLEFDTSGYTIAGSSGATLNFVTTGTNTETILNGAGFGASQIISANITGSGGLNFNSGGNAAIFAFTGSNAGYTGVMTIGGLDEVRFSSDSSIAGGGILLQADGNFAIAADLSAIDQGFINTLQSGSNGIVALGVNSSNALDFSASGANLANVALGAIVSATYTGALTPYGNQYVLGGGNIAGGAGDLLTIGGTGVLTGANNGLLVTGQLNLGGTNSYGGPTVVSLPLNDAKIQIQSAGALGNTTSLTVNSGIFDIQVSYTPSLGQGIATTIHGTSFDIDAFSAAAYGPVTWAGNIVIGTDGAVLGERFGGGQSFVLTGTLSSGNNAFAPNFATSGNGGSNVTLESNETYTGINTVISSGTVVLSSGSANTLPVTTGINFTNVYYRDLNAKVTQDTTSVLDLNGNDQTIAGLARTFSQIEYYADSVTNTGSTTAVLTVNGGGNFGSPLGNTSIAGNLSLVKTGTATLTLGGLNSYTGNTTINGGTLFVDVNQFGGNSATTPTSVSNYLPATNLTLGGGTLSLLGRITGSFDTEQTNSGSNSNILSFSSAPDPSAVALGQAVTGTGISANTYVVGIDTVDNTVILNQAVSGVTSGENITFVANNLATTQTFTGLTLNPGYSGVDANDNNGAGTTINLNAITRNVGGTVDFGLTTAGSITTTNTNTNGILGGYATVNASDWATVSGTSIIAYTGYVKDTFTPGTNTEVDNSETESSFTVNSLAFNGGENDGGGDINQILTITGTGILTSGGILLNSGEGSGPVSIVGGTLEGSSGGDLIVNQDNQNGTFTIGSTIADNGAATALTKSGLGALILTGANTYTGGTYLDSGNLEAGADNNLGASSGGLIFTGGTLETTAGFASTRAVTLTDGGIFQTDTGTFSLSGPISGGGGLTKTGAGTLALSGSSTYTGPTMINSGTLSVSSIGNGGVAGSLGAASNVASNLILNGGTLQYTGTGESSDRSLTLSSGGGTIDASGSGALTLTGSAIASAASGTQNLSFAGTSTALNTFAGPIANGAGTNVTTVTKSGSGTWSLSGANTYTGITTIDNGILNVATLTNGAAAPTLVTTLGSTSGTVSDATGLVVGQTVISTDLPAGTTITAITGTVVTLSAPPTASGTNPANIGTPNPLGLSTNAAANLVFGGGTLQYTGTTSAASTDRLITIGDANGNTGAIDSSSTVAADTVSFTNTGSVAFTNSAPHTLALVGTNTGGNTFASAIGDQSAGNATTVVKSGAGTWLLTGANTYSGGTTINGGILSVASTGALGTSVSANTITLSGTGTVIPAVLQYTGGVGGALAQNFIVSAADTGTVSNTGGNTLTLAGMVTFNNSVLTFSGGAFDVTGQLTGGTISTFNSNLLANMTATVILDNTNNNYDGTTSVYGGATLRDGMGKAPAGTVLTLGNVSDGALTNTFDLNGNNQTLGALDSTSNGGGTNVNLVTNSAASGTSTLTLSGFNSDSAFVNSLFGGVVQNGATAHTAVAVTGGTSTFTGSNTYSGGTTISSGTFYANNTVGSGTGAGTVAVNSGGTLAGSGIIAPVTSTANAITVVSSGLVMPGAAQMNVPFAGTPGTAANGNLTLNPTGVTGASQLLNVASSTNSSIPSLTFALGAGGPSTGENFSGSKLIVSGSTANVMDFNVGGTGSTVVSIDDLVGSNLSQEYVLIEGNGNTTYENNGAVLSTGLITGGLSLLTPSAGNYFSQNYNSSQLFLVGDNIDIEVAAVPEPGTWAMLLGGLAVLIFWRRRKLLPA